MFPPGLHVAPVRQLAHWPCALHTWFVPQIVPAAALASVSVHAIAPLLQAATPWWHGLLAGVQGAPALHGAHVPALQ